MDTGLAVLSLLACVGSIAAAAISEENSGTWMMFAIGNAVFLVMNVIGMSR